MNIRNFDCINIFKSRLSRSAYSLAKIHLIFHTTKFSLSIFTRYR